MAETWGHGTTLKYGAVGAAYADMTAFSNIEKIDAGKSKRKSIKKTTLTSASQTEEKRPGMIDQDAMKLEVQYVEAQHLTLHALFLAGTEQDFVFCLGGDGLKIRRKGFLMEFDAVPKADNEDILHNNISIEFTGPPDFDTDN